MAPLLSSLRAGMTEVRHGAARMVRLLRQIRLSLHRSLVIVFALLAFAVWASFFRINPSTFSIDAETEVLTGSIMARPQLRATHSAWRLEDLCIGGPRCEHPTAGVLEIRSAVNFRIERLSSGPLHLHLQPLEGAAPEEFSVRFHRDEPPGGTTYEELAPPVILTVRNPGVLAGKGRPVTLPLTADELTLGQQPGQQSFSVQPLLRSGTLSLLGRTLLGNRVYVARSIDLRIGDQVRIDPAVQSASRVSSVLGPFSCVIRVEDSPATRISYQVRGSRAEVRSFFSDPRVEVVTWFDRISNDPLLIALWSLLGLMLGVAGVAATSAPAEHSGGGSASAAGIPTHPRGD